jgi:hypothetical protein
MDRRTARAAASLIIAATADIRVGILLSDIKHVHVGKQVVGRLTTPDLGIALCGQPVMLICKLSGPPSNPWSAADKYCDACVAGYNALVATALGEQQVRMAL